MTTDAITTLISQQDAAGQLDALVELVALAYESGKDDGLGYGTRPNAPEIQQIIHAARDLLQQRYDAAYAREA